jgi:hypothetical protein
MEGVEGDAVLKVALAHERSLALKGMRVALVLACLTWLLPVIPLISELLHDHTERLSFCAGQAGPDFKVLEHCMQKQDFPGLSCDGTGERFNACNEAMSLCQKSAVTRPRIEACASHIRSEALTKVLMFAAVPIALMLVVAWYRRALTANVRRLAEAFLPGRVRAIQPTVIETTIHGARVAERDILRLYLVDSTDADLGPPHELKDAVVKALLARNPGCVPPPGY